MSANTGLRDQLDDQPRGSVLFVTDANAQERDALFRAFALAHVLDCDLRLVHLAPETVEVNPLLPHLTNAALTSTALQRLAKLDALASFAHENVPSTFGSVQLDLRVGDPHVQLRLLADEANAALVVIAADSEGPWFGGAVSHWVGASGVPMLVVYPTSRTRGLVAEPVRGDEGNPVLRSIAALNAHLESPVTLVRGEASAEPEQEKAVRNAARRCGLDGADVVVSGKRAADALLEEVRRRRADLVVVGTQRRGWFERVFSDDTATRLISSREVSVLVVPTDDLPAIAAPGRLRAERQATIFIDGETGAR